MQKAGPAVRSSPVMTARHPDILLLGLGNDILGDDAVGIVAARLLKKEFRDEIDIVEAAAGGLELMELLAGYKKVLILDAIITNEHPPGTILELSKEEFKSSVAIAPHYVSLPEAFQLAEELGITFPVTTHILAMEIRDPFELREGLSPAVENALPLFLERAKKILSGLL